MSTPKPPQEMKAVLVTAPQHCLGTLYYVWKQSRSNKPLPTPEQIEYILNNWQKYSREELGQDLDENWGIYNWSQMLGYSNIKECAKHIRSEVDMILHEGIPVTENLHFVFHLQNIPISLREQMVRHRIGTKLDPRVGMDIIPEPLSAIMADAPGGALMHMSELPDLAESTWWSQTSRVIPYTEFFDEGRYILPKGLIGKKVISSVGVETDAEEFYTQVMAIIQECYKKLVESGVHIEDARQLIPVGATHGITWTLNLKAIAHIFGKRSSWISQIGIWEQLIMQMIEELCTKVHPTFRMLAMPQCIKKGKYVGCPVNGTNAERIAGIDGMPPCPLWVRYETQNALNAVTDTEKGAFPGAVGAAWKPHTVVEGPHAYSYGGSHEVSPEVVNVEMSKDIRNWTTDRPVELEMLNRTAAQYSKLWGFDVFDGLPKEEA